MSSPAADPTSTGIVDLLADLYVWGFPLVAIHRTRARQLRTVGPRLDHDQLATAANRAVVGPNNDTLYTSVWVDLAAGDLTVTVPRLVDPERYWSVMLLDAYTQVAYISRRTHGRDGTTVRVTWDAEAAAEQAERVTDGADVVAMATPTMWVLVRVLVDGPDDLDAAREAQHAIGLSQPGVDDLGSNRGDRADDAGERSFFEALTAAVAIDPPAAGQAPPPPGGLELLADCLARVSQGDDGAAALLAEAERAGTARLSAAGSGADTFGNGWGTRRRGAAFGADATYRAAFARVSLAGHLPAENRGYNRQIDAASNWQLRFPPGGEPPVGAFWSLTLYGPDLFFVGNDLGRYSIGDRTPGLRRDPDGGLTITIGHEPPLGDDGAPDPSNWLPAPAGPAFAVLRCYEGAPPIVDATWFPPPLEPALAGASEHPAASS